MKCSGSDGERERDDRGSSTGETCVCGSGRYIRSACIDLVMSKKLASRSIFFFFGHRKVLTDRSNSSNFILVREISC